MRRPAERAQERLLHDVVDVVREQVAGERAHEALLGEEAVDVGGRHGME
jgi:hypothetical protein